MKNASPTVLLAVDVGNSAIKLGRFPWPYPVESPEPTDVLRLKTRSPDSAVLRQWLPQESVICVLASVQRQAADQLLTWLRQSTGTAVAHVLSLADFPLRVAVRYPERVGQDRLAAAVAAARVKRSERSAVIVDAGSAVTVDAVSPEGVFLGGAILPGLQTAAAALATAADLLPRLDTSDWTAPPIIGTSTEQAIHSGVFWGTMGAIHEIVTRTRALLEKEHEAACDVVLTGGHAGHVTEHVAFEAICRPHLVLTGIAITAPLLLGESGSMTEGSQTIVALLTPRGRGAIASVLIRGPEAASSVDQLFAAYGRSDCSAAPSGQVLVGRWQDRRTPRGTQSTASGGEELVVCCTGLNQVEVHCHGGRAAAAAIIQSLCQLGCQEVDWSEALGVPNESPLRSAARIALSAARTQRTAAILLDQYNGALERSLEQLLVELARADPAAATLRLDALLGYRTFGLHLTRPWRVALAGPPNVGKSSLINAIMGFQRAVVVDDPGTTRDVVTTTTAVDGWPVELSDTAGLREAIESLEAAGIRQARERLARSDSIILVFDATRPLSPGEHDLLAQYPEAILVANKCDLAPSAGAILPHALPTSALTRAGLDRLLHVLSQRLVPHSPEAGEAVPFAESHAETLMQARDALHDNQWQRARQHIERLLAR